MAEPKKEETPVSDAQFFAQQNAAADQQVAKPNATPPAGEQPAVPTAPATAAVLKTTDGPIPKPTAPSLPGPLGSSYGKPSTTPKDDEKTKELDARLKEKLIDQMFQMAKEQRDDKRWWAQHAATVAERQASQRRPWKFTANMNGVTGHASFKVQWFNADGAKSNGTTPGANLAGGGEGGMDGKRFADAIYDIVHGKKGGNKPAKPGQKGPLLPADGDWMPKDLTDGKNPFTAEDFFGAGEEGHTGRFGGGYRDPAYRERYIQLLMGNRRAGEAGYERALKAAEEKWKRAEQDFDKRFKAYGEDQMNKQRTKKAESKGDKAAMGAGDTETLAKLVVDQSRAAADSRAIRTVARPLNRRT